MKRAMVSLPFSAGLLSKDQHIQCTVINVQLAVCPSSQLSDFHLREVGPSGLQGQHLSYSNPSKTARLSHRYWHPRNGRRTGNEADRSLDILQRTSINSYESNFLGVG
ncbi:hypothetical protein CPC08DRAFT_771402 [Agrocybe pediades]|nr:hypothetical protein CPC08DRAFT_771402 [Agrocybe pediades]